MVYCIESVLCISFRRVDVFIITPSKGRFIPLFEVNLICVYVRLRL